ncbi:MAG: LPS export ABC transporter periplasmic protein LptC [Flavobacteriales bacterium]|nr:LPS export ABC transporter periplasmic protein LptC [Flavobacteriales bacterium]
MGRVHRTILLGIPALLGAGMFFSCRNDLDKVAAVEMPEAGPDRVTFDAEYLMSDSGHVRNRLRAGRIAEWTGGERQTELADGLELIFLDADGGQRGMLTAQRGTIRPEERRMEVQDDVVFINVRGERLETERLVWSQDSARVSTDRPVRIQRGQDVIHGVGLDAAEDMSSYTIRRITGELYLAPDSVE